MIQAWLVYYKEDYIKNSYFANALMEHAHNNQINLKLVLREKIVLGMQGNILFAAYDGEKEYPEIVINRSRDSFLAKHLELMGIRVYNSYEITQLCNNKARTHQFISGLGIPAVDTLFCNKSFFDSRVAKLGDARLHYPKLGDATLHYPLVIKSASGHGGSEVFKCETIQQLESSLSHIKEEEFLIQELCDCPGIDVRVFVMGTRILGAIKRESKQDFRSNYSLGGTASLYQLTTENKAYVQKIINDLKSDFVGIDFMINKQGDFLFNEIEDAVGSRTLYEYAKIDIAKEYIAYINHTQRI